MATPAQIAYTHLDDYDRDVFDHVLSNDIERYAFIRFFQHVDANYPRNKRPRTGHSRVRLWNKSRRYWIRKAQAQQPLPAIQRSAPAAPPGPAASVAPVIPLALPAPTLSMQLSSASNEIAPVQSLNHAFALNATGPSGNTQIQPSANILHVGGHAPVHASIPPSSTPISGTKRTREHDDDPSVVSQEPPAKRRLPAIGGERCPPFVLHNGLYETKANVPKFFPLAPTLQQREFVQKTLGGTWRYAKTLHQQSISSIVPKPRSGVAPRSNDLFVKIDEQGLIQDRVVVKCTDVSWDKDKTSKERVHNEEAVIHTIPDACRQLPSYRGIAEHSMKFTIDGGYLDNEDPSRWIQQYMFSEYAPHSDLHQLIENHNRAKRAIPEHFIWYVFKQLVEALTTLATGHCSDTHDGPITAKKDGWHRILHLDVKGGNVLLGSPDPKYASYHQPILTDFDTSIRLSSDPKRRAEQIQHARGSGTKYLQAPEMAMQHRHTKHYRPMDWSLDHWTDIYSLGLLIRHMMLCSTKTTSEMIELQKEEATIFPAEALSRDSDPEYEFHWKSYPDIYSTALIRTVHRCLAFRPFPDRAKPKKAWRPSLQELQTRIDSNLARLDAMCGDEIKTAQHNTDHPLHVLFPKEDPQCTIGARFTPPEPPAVAKDRSLAAATDDEKGNARNLWAAHVARFGGGVPLYLPQPSMQTMDQVMSELIPQSREKLASVEGLAPSKREAYFQALQHATTTISKCVNPHGSFTQLRAKIPPNFLAPETKRDTLNLLKQTAQQVLDSLETSLPDKNAAASIREREMASAAEALSSAEAEQDLVEMNLAREKINFLEEREALKVAEAAQEKETIDALTLLMEAADMGVDLLVLGEELELDTEQIDSHWMAQISALHRGVWEYFWSWPSGVFTYI